MNEDFFSIFAYTCNERVYTVYKLVDLCVLFSVCLCCESRYQGVPESTGEFLRVPEIDGFP